MMSINTHCQWLANLAMSSDQHHSVLADHSAFEVGYLPSGRRGRRHLSSCLGRKGCCRRPRA